MARLVLGVLAGQPFWTLLTGDESMRSRPMGRVAEPLTRMGARIVGRAEGTRLPLAVRGAERLSAIDYTLPVASAQVKSAILLAGLAAELGPRVKRVEQSAVLGHPAEEIINAAREPGVDLVVVGARGLGPVKRLVLGSVSERVLHQAPSSVLVVKGRTAPVG